MKTKNERPLTTMQLETLAMCYFGELSIVRDNKYQSSHLSFYHDGINVTGRTRSLFRRRLLRGNYACGELIGFIVTPAGIAEFEKNPEIVYG